MALHRLLAPVPHPAPCVVVARFRQEADIVILLSHAGIRIDEQIAAAVTGIDVIECGHSHTRLSVGAFVWSFGALKHPG